MGHRIHFSGATDTQRWRLTPPHSRHSTFLFGAEKNRGTLFQLAGCAEVLVLPSYQIPPLCLSLSISACLCYSSEFWLAWDLHGVPSLPPVFSDYISDTCFSHSSFSPGHTTEKNILCSKVCDLVSGSLRAQRLGIWWCLSGLRQSREACVTKE